MRDDDGESFGPGPLRGLRVLLVEDSAATAYLIENYLIESGARHVATCATSTEAADCLAELEIDFVLIDMMLADQFADELIDETIGRKIPFAILTGMLALPSNSHEHAVAVLRKPVSKQCLVDLLAPYA